MIDNKFDKILKQKLNQLAIDWESDWDIFEQKLDDAQEYDTYNQENFDAKIKQKIAGLTTSAASSDWSQFEHLLDKDQLTDQEIDQKISHEMNNMRAPYRQDHWELLHDSLEYQKVRNLKILRYKIVELSLLFLLLLSANNLYKYLPSSFELEKPVIYASQDQDNTHFKNPTDYIDHTKVSSESAIVNKPISAKPSTSIDPRLKDTRADISAQHDLRNQYNITHDPVLSDAPIDYSNSIAALQVSDPIVKIETEPKEDRKIEISQIKNIPFSLDAERRPINVSDDFQIADMPLSTKDQRHNWLTLYASIDNNLVQSPFDKFYKVSGHNTYGIGYSAGIEYSIQKKNLEGGLGFSYANRSYDPRYIEEVTNDPDKPTNYYETSLEHISFDILSISALVKLIVLEKNGYTLDLALGLSANTVIYSDYRIASTIPNRLSVTNRDFSLTLDEKPLHDGIFEGGALADNLYLTTDISLCISKKLSNENYLTFRPKYSIHNMSDGIGPNNDEVNNLSFNVGLKHML